LVIKETSQFALLYDYYSWFGQWTRLKFGMLIVFT